MTQELDRAVLNPGMVRAGTLGIDEPVPVPVLQ
jgi:hypothetical protein